MANAILDWIMEEDPWMRYAAETQLLSKPSDASAVFQDERMRAILDRLRDPSVGLPALRTGKVRYTGTGNAFWDLYFLADIGLHEDTLQLRDAADTLFAMQRDNGTLILQEGTKPEHLCIPAILLSSLARLGYAEDPHILRFVQRIWDTRRLDGGWHCALSRAAGKKLQDTESCPMDNLNILMLLSQYKPFRSDSKLNGAIDLLLTHWRRRADPWRPYGFGVGSDFRKLKYPAAKYGILRVLDVLSLYPYAVRSPEFGEMLDFVLGKSEDGKYTAESGSRSYSMFDFGQTKAPSRWITFLVLRIQKRVHDLQKTKT